MCKLPLKRTYELLGTIEVYDERTYTKERNLLCLTEGWWTNQLVMLHQVPSEFTPDIIHFKTVRDGVLVSESSCFVSTADPDFVAEATAADALIAAEWCFPTDAFDAYGDLREPLSLLCAEAVFLTPKHKERLATLLTASAGAGAGAGAAAGAGSGVKALA